MQILRCWPNYIPSALRLSHWVTHISPPKAEYLFTWSENHFMQLATDDKLLEWSLVTDPWKPLLTSCKWCMMQHLVLCFVLVEYTVCMEPVLYTPIGQIFNRCDKFVALAVISGAVTSKWWLGLLTRHQLLHLTSHPWPAPSWRQRLGTPRGSSPRGRWGPSLCVGKQSLVHLHSEPSCRLSGTFERMDYLTK